MAAALNNFFKELLEYNHHYNQQLAEMIINGKDKLSEKTFILFSHILNAHHIWNSRINAMSPAFAVWDIQDFDNYLEVNTENYNASLLILEKYELDKLLNYSNTKGQQFSNSIRDILFHAINHSNYHRAQIATEFKNAGLVPLSADYIFYKR